MHQWQGLLDEVKVYSRINEEGVASKSVTRPKKENTPSWGVFFFVHGVCVLNPAARSGNKVCRHSPQRRLPSLQSKMVGGADKATFKRARKASKAEQHPAAFSAVSV
jgi:hypothetical protein